jgi:hypothetical protein
MTRRDKVDPHTDKASGRNAWVRVLSRGTGQTAEHANIQWQEEWEPLPREAIPTLIGLFRQQEQRLRLEAVRIQVDLDTSGHGSDADG